VLILLGEILLFEREDERAHAMLEESLALFKGIKERFGTALALISFARLLVYRGEHEAAQACYKESWELLGTNGDKELTAAFLEGYGEVLVAQGEAKLAVQLWGIAATIRADIVAPMPPIYRSDYVQALAFARESLDEEAFKMAWVEGSQTSPYQVLLTH
jgi:tetratricopeptide (TPR) repeat protein